MCRYLIMRWLFLLIIFLYTQLSFSQTYHQLLTSTKAKKDSLYKEYQKADSLGKEKIIEQTANLLVDQLTTNIFPKWYGTEWDYEGYTNVPQQGQVACGYFVSTPLKHVGFNLNRYKLAQKYSHAIVKTLCNNIQYIRENDTEKLFHYINSKPNQLYVVGLDNHVGFLLKEKTGIYFIHSSYLDPVAVVKEKAAESEALLSSGLFVLGHFSSNRLIIKSWLAGELIEIIKN